MKDGKSICPECMAAHDRKRSRFCCATHQKAWNNRQVSQGAAIVALAKAWALGRGGGHTPAHPASRKAMAQLTTILREFNDADKATGRMPATDYAEMLMADTIPADRLRRKTAA